jgi:hypothetical protein
VESLTGWTHCQEWALGERAGLVWTRGFIRWKWGSSVNLKILVLNPWTTHQQTVWTLKSSFPNLLLHIYRKPLRLCHVTFRSQKDSINIIHKKKELGKRSHTPRTWEENMQKKSLLPSIWRMTTHIIFDDGQHELSFQAWMCETLRLGNWFIPVGPANKSSLGALTWRDHINVEKRRHQKGDGDICVHENSALIRRRVARPLQNRSTIDGPI